MKKYKVVLPPWPSLKFTGFPNPYYPFSEESFRITVKSDNVGDSANDEFIWRQGFSGDANYSIRVVETNQIYEVSNDNDVTITFSDGAGTYTLQIEGTGFVPRYNNVSDKLKVLDIQKWGNCLVSRDGFYGCSNLTVSATESPTFNADCNDAFRACTSFTGSVCDTWDMSAVTCAEKMFQDSTLFNGNVFNTGTLSLSASMGARSMFNKASAFNQDLTNADYTVVDTLENFIKQTATDSTNYNAFLIELQSQAQSTGITPNMPLGADDAVATGAGVTARSWLIANTGMIITDATP